MHELSTGAEYGFILLYLAVLLVDDALIYVAAKLTLRAAAVAGRYARSSHLIGGGVLLVLRAVIGRGICRAVTRQRVDADDAASRNPERASSPESSAIAA